MAITNFTEEETETLVMSLEMFITKYFPKSEVPYDKELQKLMNILSSRTMTDQEIEEYSCKNTVITLNLYRNELCFFAFRNLYLMHYGKSILEIPCPMGREKDYGLTILRSPNMYREGSDLPTKDLWPNSVGILEWVPDGCVRISLTDVQKDMKAKKKEVRKKKKIQKRKCRK